MKQLGFIVGFLPWIVFVVVSQRLAANGVAWSAVIAVAVTLIAILMAFRSRGPKILNIGSLVLFAVIAIVGFVGGRPTDEWLYTWASPLVGVVLGLYVLATVPFLPFTEEYARQSTPREYWGSPTFVKINRTLSAAWGVAILLIGLASVLVAVLDGQAQDTSSNHLVDLVLNWVIPIALIWFMVKFTISYPDRVRADAPAQQPTATHGGVNSDLQT